ncbi:MAG: type domain protein [Haloplasmataceae bacterium]|nr:type domain protein [Haloplasmataceae bacterium]
MIYKVSRNSYKKVSLTLIMLFFITFISILVGCSKKTTTNSNPIVTSDNVDYTPSRTVTNTNVVVYEGPNVMETSSKVGIKVEDKNLFVYETLINLSRAFSYTLPTTIAPVAMFDFEGSVTVTITVTDETITKAVVRPLAYGIEPQISGNKMTFQLDYSANYVIEYNDKVENTIHLFANPIEENTPDPENIPDDMIYIGPGVYKADAIPVESNKTIYISGGAVVYGQIRAEGVENVTLRGRGIISGAIYTRTRASEYTIPVEFRKSSNIKIEGITFLNPAGWTILSYFVDGLEIDNVKIMTARANGDGISIQSSKNVEVKNSFVRTFDDNLVVKNVDRGTTSNVTINNMVLWTDLAQSMEIGYETNGPTIDDITFKNITVLHNFHKPVMSIHNADDAAISNVLFQNITVEDAQMIGDNNSTNQDDFLIDFTVVYSQEWTESGGVRGTIENVIIDNILIMDGSDDLVSRISGFDASHKITNVSINNVTYKGVKVDSSDDLRLSANQHTSNITYNFTASESTGAKLILPYKLSLANGDIPNVNVVSNIDQEGYLVPSFAIREIPQVYMGAKVIGNFTGNATHGTGTLVWDDGTGSFENGTKVAQNVLDGNKATSWLGKEWSNLTGEYAALNINFDEDKKIGTIRVYGDINSAIYLLQNIAVYGIKSTSTNNVYTKMLNAADYEFSPASGNFIDIKLSPGEYKSVQLRFYNKPGVAYPSLPFVSEVEFYPASLTFNKAVTATTHEDVYDSSNITDGNPVTYYESEKGTWPAEVAIDMQEVYNIKYIYLYLPPLMQWEPRIQKISLYVSDNGDSYREIIAEKDYSFDSKTGNLVEILLDHPESARFIKFKFSENSAAGEVGAQISEINVFE